MLVLLDRFHSSKNIYKVGMAEQNDDRPGEREHFKNALIHVVQLNEAQADRLIMQDISMSSELSYVDDETLMLCFQANNRPTAGKKMRLMAFKMWIREQQANEGFGNVSSNYFTNEELTKMLEQVGNGQKRTIDASQRNNVRDIKEPEPWLGKPQDWRKRKRELIAYMAKRRNCNNVPFLYLIREEQGYIETDDNDMSVIIRDTPHHGSVYQADNYEFFQVLISWTSGGTMQALVDRYRSTQDGRSAWQMIITMMDGQDSRNARIKDADARIDNAFYREDRSQFTFEQYCAVHITSNIEMEGKMSNVMVLHKFVNFWMVSNTRACKDLNS